MTQPAISTVILNWNRRHLLQVTVESYLSTVSVPYELTIVDNASTDGSQEYVEAVCRQDPRHRSVLLTENLGGDAINYGLQESRAPYLHVSENDLEYLPGWDKELLGKLDAFPELWQLSPFAPSGERARGEIWEEHEAEPVTRGAQTICLAELNVGTTCVCRRQLWDRGFRWSSLPEEPGSPFRLPNDFAASIFVRQLGYWVAWNDKYTVINWGHNVAEWQKDPEYYLWNYRSKSWVGQEGLRQRLLARGYDLVQENGQFRIAKL